MYVCMYVNSNKPAIIIGVLVWAIYTSKMYTKIQQQKM